jgi:hypothetical protein
MNEVVSQLDALDDALSTRPERDKRQRECRERLQDHHKKLRQSTEAKIAKGDAWIKQCQPLVKLDWSFNNYDTVIACAKEINETISARGSSSTPASDNERSSSKRKHTEEPEGSAPKAARSSAAASVPRNPSVRAGASEHQPPSVGNRPGEVEGADLITPRPPSAANPQPSRSALPGGSPDDAIEELSGSRSHEEEVSNSPAREPVDLRTYLHLPAHGAPGRHMSLLISSLPQFPLSFINWCGDQLLRSRLPNFEAVEPLTEAFILFFQNTLPDHDWENEPDVPFLPFSVEDFERPWAEGRNWPNVRRLLKIVEGNDVCHTYFMRHISYEGVIITAANRHSANYIRLVQRKGGPEYDWEQEDDQIRIRAPPLRETLAIPLQGLPPAGRWSVSDLIYLFPCLSLTKPLTVRKRDR